MKTRSLSAHYHHTTPGSSILLACVDLRTTAQKIEDLKSEMRQTSVKENISYTYKSSSSIFVRIFQSKNKLDNLLLMQVYVKLEYGDISIENARAYLHLSQYYFQRKLHFLAQAKFHAMNAHQILEQLRIQPNDDHFQENQLAYDIYFMLVQCSLNAKQREMKSSNKHILSIDKTHIEHDLNKLEKYFDKLKHFLKQSQLKKLQKEFLLLKFDSISMNLRKYNPMIFQIIEQILNLFSDNIQFQIGFYQRCGLYLINFEESESDGLMYYRKSVELADKQQLEQPSIDNKYELANAILQRNIAKIQRERLTNEIESEFQRAIQFYRQPTGETSKNVLKVIDELANYYVKIEKYQVKEKFCKFLFYIRLFLGRIECSL